VILDHDGLGGRIKALPGVLHAAKKFILWNQAMCEMGSESHVSFSFKLIRMRIKTAHIEIIIIWGKRPITSGWVGVLMTMKAPACTLPIRTPTRKRSL
jgi:hypothetical protein